MSKPTLAPTKIAVKKSAAPLRSGQLSERLAAFFASPKPGLTLPTNLTAQAFALAHLPEVAFAAGVLWYLPSSRDFERAQDLATWLGGATHYTTCRFPDDLTEWLRLKRSKTPTLLLVSHEHLELALPSPRDIAAATVTFTTGEQRKPFETLRQLEAAGYEPGPLPDATGWFVKQGGSITIVTTTSAWRVNWQGDVVERIAPLNLATGLAGEPVPSATVMPRRLAPAAGTTLASYLTPELTLVAAPALSKGQPPRALPLDPLRESALFRGVPLFGKQWTEVGRFITSELAAHHNVTLVTAEPRFTQKRLPADTPPVPMVEVPERLASLVEGFIDTSSDTAFLTDHELVGVRRRTFRRSLSSYEHLAPGDYLVHIDHGIGQFEGLTSQSLDGITREYFMVAYAENDKLYVPIEHTDRLSRYLGSPHPKLERLSSASWFQTTKKVRAEAAELARELLTVYAKRHAQVLKPWQHVAEEEVLAASFPWPLTSDQLKAWAEISADLDNGEPMDRLVCGDVGFGKTELAVRAAFRAVKNGYQAAVLVPTTILAQQHFDTFSERLASFGVRVGVASRAQDAATIRQTLKALKSGQLDVIIGTHRLLARDVTFGNLGLMVVDEEQRFGVKQKEALMALKPGLHVLALSATPIPRTLHLAVSSIRDLSLISTPPAGRLTVEVVFSQPEDNIIRAAVRQELDRHGQAYFLVHHISDLPQAAARLTRLFPKLRLGIIHGQLPPKEVAHTMRQFDERELDVLLATTIIENGIDLPNVNTLIVEGAQEFGLADLYQLKGRVGRSPTRAYAYFLVDDKHSAAADKRLEALREAEALGSGLTVALKDLELRGAGAILGKEQHGQVSAVGLHLYGQLLAQAVEELRTGELLPAIPEVRIRLPLEGRIAPELIPEEEKRIQAYQRLASVREPSDLKTEAEAILGRPLTDEAPDRLFKNLLTLLELKLLAERARLHEVACQMSEGFGRFSLRFLEHPDEETVTRLTGFDETWHKVESTWQAEHMLAVGAWIPWLRQSLKCLGR